MKKRVAVIVVALVAGIGLLAGCTKGPGAGSETPTPTQTVVASSGKPVTTQRGVTIQDATMGHVIQITAFLNDLPISANKASQFAGTLKGGSVVALHVTATAGAKYFTYLYDTNFTLSCVGMDAQMKPNTSNFADDLSAAGYTPWENPIQGTSMDGWMTYIVPTTKYPIGCSVTYTRAPQDTPSGLKLPEYTETVTLN